MIKMNQGGSAKNILEDEATQELLGFSDFPYRSKLSFVPLINYWKKKTTSRNYGEAVLAKEIIKRLDASLEFLAPIGDSATLSNNNDLVELLMGGLFPLALRDQQMAQASAPFSLGGFYYTPKLNQLLKKGNLGFTIDKTPEKVRASTVLRACCMILNKFYGENIMVEDPYIFTVQPEYGEVEKHYKSEVNNDFVEIKKLQPLQHLSKEQIQYLIRNLYDIDLWLKYIPPTHFEFHGCVCLQLIDVTEEESLSRLKNDLLQKDAIISNEGIAQLEGHLQAYLGLSSLRLGITVLDDLNHLTIAHQYKLRHHFLARRFDNLLSKQYPNSIYEQACNATGISFFDNLELIENRGILEQSLVEEGISSIVIVPLIHKNGEVFGILELGSSNPYDLNTFFQLRIEQIRPLFRTALRRSRQEIHNEIEAIIRENYTTIHSSVEWRFLEEAYQLMELRGYEEKVVSPEPIIFNDVYPLFGQADIVSSSTIRNDAIQKDFQENFKAIEAILLECRYRTDVPMLEEFLTEVQNKIKLLDNSLSPDYEYGALEFIRNEIHPFFESLRLRHPMIESAINQYFVDLDPKHKTIYKNRKHYETSVAMINDEISQYLEEEEKRIQKMLPHYYQAYRTDGVQYDIFAGQSLLKQGQFEPMQLQTLRTWQLINMCEITRLVEELQDKLIIPLTTAQLILVHSTPLSIRFRLDEKKFDVDGAYNIRYAIIKKRIDKAYIQNTNERLTVSGKIAIVYTKEQDRGEYMGYLRFLLKKGYIEENIEELTLNNLQGVVGLNALRVTVRKREP